MWNSPDKPLTPETKTGNNRQFIFSDFSTYTQEQLWQAKTEIDLLITGKSLSELDLEQELLAQLHITKSFLNEVINETEIPANQRAQAINSCTSILTQLSKTQIELYNAERVKAMESALIKALKKLDKEAQEEFFKRYEVSYRTPQKGSPQNES